MKDMEGDIRSEVRAEIPDLKILDTDRRMVFK
jgi:hypothetical protein